MILQIVWIELFERVLCKGCVESHITCLLVDLEFINDYEDF